MNIASFPLATPPYQLIRSLGEGGYGQVFEAWDGLLQRRVAIKRLKAVSAAHHPYRLLDEARAAASLRHPAFVKIYAFDDEAEEQSIVMELVEGQTLGQLIRDTALAPASALAIAGQIADAMREAHQAHLVHGDLKPSNLMYEPSGSVRILDFGLARQIDPLATQSATTGQLHGTIAYLAPERLLGAAANPSSDIYAVGVVLYELLTGHRPLANLSGLALAAAQLQTSSEQWQFPPQLPPAVTALVQAMTARDPVLRLSSMQAVRAAIEALSTGTALRRPRRIGPIPLLARIRRGRAGRAGPAALAAAILAAVLLASAWHLAGSVPALPFSTARSMAAGLDALRSADRNGSLDTAIGHFNAILLRQPHHAGAAAGLSLAYSLRYFGEGRDEVWLARADASAQQALQDDPQLALAHTARAWVLEYQGQTAQALQEEQAALQLDPLDLFAQWGRIDLLINLRRYAEARQALTGAMAAHPEQRLLYDLSGRLHFQQGQLPAAEQDFRRSIALEPDLSYAYANLHAVLLRQDRAEEGLQVLQQGLQVHPSSRLYSSLGTALFYRGDYLGAQKNFELAVSSGRGSPNQYLYWANLGDALRWLPGREADARQAYQQAAALLQPLLARSSHNATYQSRLGLYLAKLGNGAAAADWTRRALQAAPDSADAHFRACLVYEISGNRSAALVQLQQALTLGYPAHLIAMEPDLLALRRDPLYRHLHHESVK
ncbi:protein kinase domain-containing protein [Duganella hordei]|uniref:protein kinase domain-containing protein n=1 Tax=Duganella hordei TaxID=2865934 RepID=UPI0030E8E8F4